LKKVHFITIVLTVFTLLLSACGSNATSGGGKQVTIGAKNFTEQFLLSKITAIYLEDNGFTVTEKNNLGSTALRKALLNEQVDLAWEYTGTGLVTYLKQEPIADPQETFKTVKKLDKKKNNVVWMNMSDVNNTYALLMQAKQAKKLGIQSISDLADYVNKNTGDLTLATNAEFASRSDGLKGIEKAYGFQFGAENVKKMSSGLTYKALKNDQVDVAMGFATDARIKAYDLNILKDSKNFFPAYHAAVSIRQDVLEKHPELEKLTADVAEKLDSTTMRDLNYRVDIKQEQVEDVARNWLEKAGLLKK
jgi:osmoprotectant transport system substrate-binding protein